MSNCNKCNPCSKSTTLPLCNNLFLTISTFPLPDGTFAYVFSILNNGPLM